MMALDYNPESLVRDSVLLINFYYFIYYYFIYLELIYAFVCKYSIRLKKNAHFTAAKVHMLLGNWGQAMRSAEQVNHFIIMPP